MSCLRYENKTYTCYTYLKPTTQSNRLGKAVSTRSTTPMPIEALRTADLLCCKATVSNKQPRDKPVTKRTACLLT